MRSVDGLLPINRLPVLHNTENRYQLVRPSMRGFRAHDASTPTSTDFRRCLEFLLKLPHSFRGAIYAERPLNLRGRFLEI